MGWVAGFVLLGLASGLAAASSLLPPEETNHKPSLSTLLLAATPTPTPTPTPTTTVTPHNNDGNCDYTHAADKCWYVQHDSDCAGTLVQYLELYACHPDLRAPLCVVYVVWMVLVFYLLGTTADAYFCPQLEALSDRLGLTPRVAGVTLLSLGNGAPDIFSAIAAIRDNNMGLVLGDLSGGGMFVCSVVAGGVIHISGGLAAGNYLMREVVMYLVVVVATCVCLHFDFVNLYAAAAMLCYYIAYVCVVFYSDRKGLRKLQRQNTYSALPLGAIEPPRDDDNKRPSRNVDTLARYFSIPHPGEPRLSNREIAINTIRDGVDWLEGPFNVARSLTVVDALSESWSPNRCSRLLASLSVALTPLFVAFWQGALSARAGQLPLWAPLLIVGGVLGLAVFVTSPSSHPPRYSLALIVVAFIASAIWIDIIATELVEVLGALGCILDVSQLVLGITVLAWGNCVGDLTADCLMARNKREAMAITACYAGPLFNILIGIGIGVLARGSAVKASLSTSVAVSFGFLAGVLVATVLVGLALKRRLPKRYSVLLWISYVAYMGVMLGIEL